MGHKTSQSKSNRVVPHLSLDSFPWSETSMQLSFLSFLFFFFYVPNYISGVHHFGWDLCVRDFFNPTIEVVTFRLHGCITQQFQFNIINIMHASIFHNKLETSTSLRSFEVIPVLSAPPLRFIFVFCQPSAKFCRIGETHLFFVAVFFSHSSWNSPQICTAKLVVSSTFAAIFTKVACLRWLTPQKHQYFLFCVPQSYLWGSPFWVRYLHMWPFFFNPTIEVVICHLHRWCKLGVFLFLAFTHHECQDLLSPCDRMIVSTD